LPKHQLQDNGVFAPIGGLMIPAPDADLFESGALIEADGRQIAGPDLEEGLVDNWRRPRTGVQGNPPACAAPLRPSPSSPCAAGMVRSVRIVAPPGVLGIALDQPRFSSIRPMRPSIC